MKRRSLLKTLILIPFGFMISKHVHKLKQVFNQDYLMCKCGYGISGRDFFLMKKEYVRLDDGGTLLEYPFKGKY